MEVNITLEWYSQEKWKLPEKVNYVFLSPHFPPNWFLFAKQLKHNGANVLGLGDQPYAELREEVKSNLTEYYYVPSLENYEDALRGVGYFCGKYGKISRIESHNEYWLELEAKLREDFNVFGFRPEEIIVVKHKSEMKKRYIEAGLPVVRGERVTGFDEAKAFVEKVGYPIIAKPDIGVGAENTFKITTFEELEAIDFSRGYFVEEFVFGDIVSFDGLVDKHGKLVFYTSHTFSLPILEVAKKNTHLYYYSSRTIPMDLEEIGLKTVKAFNIRERFFHLEYFRTQKDNKLICLEVNCRPPGGYTMDLFNYSNDIDLYKIYADLVCGKDVQLKIERPYFTLFISRKNHITYRYSPQQVLSKFGREFVTSHPIPDGLSLLGNSAFIFRTPEEKTMNEIIEFVWETVPVVEKTRN
jgi:hypothetical protein